MPKIDVGSVPVRIGTNYPQQYHAVVHGRSFQALGDAAGLTQYGVNLVRLEPGAASALRHWHEREDEFACIVEGELVLVDDHGETIMRPGDTAGFKAGDGNGHHFVNRSNRPAAFLVVGTRGNDELVHYSDEDLIYVRENGAIHFTRRSGAAVTD